MDPLTIAAAAGTRARLETLDLLANNIANQNTSGYKADREFYGLYVSADAALSSGHAGAPSPTELPEIERHWTDYSQGPLTATGNPLDLAISGPGYLEVNTPQGLRWTRNGSLRIGSTGKLETQSGDRLTVTPPPGQQQYQLDPNLPFEIARNGEILQDGALKGTVLIRLPGNGAAQLQKIGGSYFKAASDAQSASLPETAEIRQGYLEGANANIADSAVRLVSVMRQFEMLQKATNLGSDMAKKVIEEVGRVAG